MKKLIIIGCAVLLIQSTMAWADVSEDVIQQSFYPYKDGNVPTYPGYKPGMMINQGNVEQFKEILDEALYLFLKRGWVEIKTAPTTDFPLHESYVEATRRNAEGVKVLENGTLGNYISGRAFPGEPDINDPLAGQKLVWNYQYGFSSGDSVQIEPFWWEFRSMNNGRAERTLKFQARIMKWQQRVMFEPIPAYEQNPSQIYRSLYLLASEPFDLANTQLLIQRYRDDTKRDDAWLYLGFQRRVRRLAAGQTTDSFLGSDVMIEDFEGYNARVTDYTWEYGGSRNILALFYYHNQEDLSDDPANDPDGYHFVDVHGKGNCFPKLTYQLRRTYTLIGKPKDPNHPVSKRIINLDAQTATMPSLIVFDKKGDLWKWFPIGKAHPDHHLPVNKGTGVPLDDFATLIDVQSEHCTTLRFKTYVLDKQDSNFYSVQNLRKVGR